MADRPGWRLRHQTNRVKSVRSEARGLWNDAAGRHVNHRYLGPHESDATTAVAELENQHRALQRSVHHVEAAREHGRKAAIHASDTLDHLAEARADVTVTYDYLGLAGRYEEQAAVLEQRCADLARDAGSPCGGTPGHHGVTGARDAPQLMLDAIRQHDLQAQPFPHAHTIQFHVGLEDRALRARLSGRKAKMRASTFGDQSTAERTVDRLLKMRQHDVREWLAGSSPVKRLRGDMGEVVGRTLTRGHASPEAQTWASVVLRRDDSLPGGFFVETAFPGT